MNRYFPCYQMILRVAGLSKSYLPKGISSLLGATAALLVFFSAGRGNSISSIAFDRKGQMYFSDFIRDRIWKIDSLGNLSIVVQGKHTHHLVIDDHDNLYGEHRNRDEENPQPGLWRMTPEGDLTEVIAGTKERRSAQYWGSVFAIDGSDNIYFVRDCQILERSASGDYAPCAGNSCGDAAWDDARKRLGHLHGSMAWGPDGLLYFTDTRTIRVVARDGITTTLNGQVVDLFADPQPGERSFERIMGLAVDAAGNILLIERENRQILKILPDGRTIPVAEMGWFWSPGGLAAVGDDLYVIENQPISLGILNELIGNPRIRKIGKDGRISTVVTVADTPTRVVTAICALLLIPMAFSLRRRLYRRA